MPAAVVLILQGFWVRALILTAWGILIVHPIDNFLGPVIIAIAVALFDVRQLSQKGVADSLRAH